MGIENIGRKVTWGYPKEKTGEIRAFVPKGTAISSVEVQGANVVRLDRSVKICQHSTGRATKIEENVSRNDRYIIRSLDKGQSWYAPKAVDIDTWGKWADEVAGGAS